MLVSVLVARVVNEVRGRLLVPEGEAIKATAPGLCAWDELNRWSTYKEKGTACAVPSSHLVQSMNCNAPCNP